MSWQSPPCPGSCAASCWPPGQGPTWAPGLLHCQAGVALLLRRTREVLPPPLPRREHKHPAHLPVGGQDQAGHRPLCSHLRGQNTPSWALGLRATIGPVTRQASAPCLPRKSPPSTAAKKHPQPILDTAAVQGPRGQVLFWQAPRVLGFPLGHKPG